MGGLNFLREASVKGGLASFIPSTEVMLPMKEKILKMIKKGTIMVFLRGDLKVPACPKSTLLVNLLMQEKYEDIQEEMASFDLTSDNEIEPALIEYSLFKEVP